MSHKVHPKILKIRETKDWLSRGFYVKKFPSFLEEDFRMREFLNKKLKQASVQDIEIERSPSSIKVIIRTSRPALVIGRGGKEVEELKKKLDKIVGKVRKEPLANNTIKIEILEIKNSWTSAGLVSQWIAGQIEKGVPFRRVLKMSLAKTKDNKEVKGVRVQVSGRLNGVEISRTEWLKEGNLPRQTIRAIMDYGFYEANCKYGVIGVKVWIYKGNRFD